MAVHSINISGDSKELFEAGMKTLFASQYEGHRLMRGYEIKDNKFNIFFYHPSNSSLPFPMKEEMAIDFIWEWLKHITYPKNTYTGDGDIKKGFEIISNWEGTFIAPFYTIYGK